MCDNMVTLVNVVKSFDSTNAVDNINLDIKKGEFLTLLGPSGCGKTTTLRMIAGFEEPTEGKIMLDGEDVSEKHSYERNVNTVFQSYALFPHMNIYDNIAFGLKIKNETKASIKHKVLDALRLVRLEGYEKRMPSQLSGGQKQRVAIARAIVNNPKVLLLDEPLGALDLKLRKEMQFELKHLQQHLGITFVYVTHDQEEALIMSDRIAIMNKGKIEQIDAPDEIYQKPRTRFVADFIGETNLFEGVLSNIDGDKAEIDLEFGEVIKIKDVSLKREGYQVGEKVNVAIRPEKMKLSYFNQKDKNVLTGKLKERIFAGSVNKTMITLKEGKNIIVNEPIDDTLIINKAVNDIFVTWEYESAVVIK